MSGNTNEEFDWTVPSIDPSQVQDAMQGSETPEQIKARVEEQVRLEMEQNGET